MNIIPPNTNFCKSKTISLNFGILFDFFLYISSTTTRNDLKMKNIAIFVSGSGSNAENIVNHFASSPHAKVDIILSNKADAYALTRAERLGIDTLVFNRHDFYESTRVADELRRRAIDYIVLGGFLWLIPADITAMYPDRIINIHPALLPKFGGKGMFGDNVHKAVIEAGETESGITIHKVNDHYDSGDTLFQARVAVAPDDTYQTLAEKIHRLEQQYFPAIIEQEILKLK